MTSESNSGRTGCAGGGRYAQATLEPRDLDLRGAKTLLKALRPGPLGTRAAAEKIDAGRAMLGKGVDREMRFSERKQPRNAAWCREDVPDRIGDGSEAQFPHKRAEEGLESGKVRQERRRAAVRVHRPLAAVGKRLRRH